MATTKAGQRAVNKYVKNNYDRINFTIDKGKKAVIQTAAAERGKSVNAYIKEAVEYKLKSDTNQDIKL